MGKSNIVIGVHGAIKSGKDTTSDCLEKYLNLHDIKVSRIAFADKMKKLAAEMCNVDINWFYDQNLKTTPISHLGGITPREVMRKFGTDFGTNMIHIDVWNQHVENFIEYRFNSSDCDLEAILVTDVRFDFEVNLLRKYGLFLIHVIRPNMESTYSPHASDQPLAEGSKYINAVHMNYNLEDLQENCRKSSQDIKDMLTGKAFR